MLTANTTIAALSSSDNRALRHIIRLSGPDALKIISSVLRPEENISSKQRSITAVKTDIRGVLFDCFAYFFPHGSSYTGEMMIELHVISPTAAAMILFESITAAGARPAGPGEFTARAYLNGKLDLAQAEAVSELISGTNLYQITAAEKMLKGRLSSEISQIEEGIVELLSLLEAEMDFVEETEMFISESQAAERTNSIISSTQKLLDQNIRREAMIGMPSIGIAGLPNAGKSSLLNSLTQSQRSIVSSARATTRDILTARLRLENTECVLFDCAGLSNKPALDVLDRLGQDAAVEALGAADLVIFCHDVCSGDPAESIKLLNRFTAKKIIISLTKTDLCEEQTDKTEQEFKGYETVLISSKNGLNIDKLKKMIAAELEELAGKSDGESVHSSINQRHKDSLISCRNSCREAASHISSGNYEIASLCLRDAHETLVGIEQHKAIDEKILENIFSKFCIGK
ncbi:tRNA modification GTPase MnmE [Limihaloglobus sulfuriphilus]|uniref:tRNA modification GTPase MnmE n=1 Tax=Limihaloglobus sulfuriphilus TaxID=1851148 RepID=A0A1Q2MC99_9BACT|nr:GTPase [Limihaloglobus sulfuriphilus]AQQ70343.1 tRNA modification GTPase MnmE [Limihaloglobus sulfuriphilus]